MTTDPNAFLMSGGAPSFKFASPGDKVEGRIEDFTVQQQRDPKTQAPKFYDDGNPMEQLRVTLQTTLRDSSIANDDGKRSIYVKGQMKKAIGDAIRAAGEARIEEGGTLVVQYFADGQRSAVGLNPPKLFKAKYVAPVASVDVDSL